MSQLYKKYGSYSIDTTVYFKSDDVNKTNAEKIKHEYGRKKLVFVIAKDI